MNNFGKTFRLKQGLWRWPGWTKLSWSKSSSPLPGSQNSRLICGLGLSHNCAYIEDFLLYEEAWHNFAMKLSYVTFVQNGRHWVQTFAVYFLFLLKQHSSSKEQRADGQHQARRASTPDVDRAALCYTTWSWSEHQTTVFKRNRVRILGSKTTFAIQTRLRSLLPDGSIEV